MLNRRETSSVGCRIRTKGLWNRISSRLNARSHTDWAIEDQVKTLNSNANPYDQQAFSPFSPIADTASPWLWRYTCLLVFIMMHWQQGIDIKSKWGELSSSAECRFQTHVLWNWISSRLNAPDKLTELLRIRLTREYINMSLHLSSKVMAAFFSTKINMVPSSNLQNFWLIYEMNIIGHFLHKMY